MKKLIILNCLTFLILSTTKSQNDTIVYYGLNDKIVLKDDAIKRIEVKKISNNKYSVCTLFKQENKWTESTENQVVEHLNDSTIQIKTYSKENKDNTINRIYHLKNSNFHFQDINEKGEIKQSGVSKMLFPLHLIGEFKKFSSSGRVYRIEEYIENQMIGNRNWLESGERYVDDYYITVDEMPEYVGGHNGIRKHILETVKYPKKAQKEGIQGGVYVTFIVNEGGLVTDAVIARSLNSELDNEALRVVNSMKKWRPGKIEGKPVKVCYTIPINFELE